MSSIAALFFKLSGREQTLLVFSIWVVFLGCLFKLFGTVMNIYREWDVVGQQIEVHDMILGQEVSINKALDEVRKEQEGVSYDLRLLQNEVDNIMRKFFPASKARLFTEDTKVFEKHSRHDVRVKLTAVAWGDLKDFVKEFFLDDRQKYIFFSEVKIDPDYPKNKSEVYNATFHISSVEFSK